MSKRKNKPSGPRLHRLSRQPRLASARCWLAEQAKGDQRLLARAYRKRYGVDWPTAIRELEILGHKLDPGWVEQLLATLEGERKARARERAEREDRKQQIDFPESDETYAFIAGYTSGGYAYGITWEEWASLEAREQETLYKGPGGHPVLTSR